MNCNNENNTSKIASILEKIVFLQECGSRNNTTSCDRPFLGDITDNPNTRPLNIYTCMGGNLLEIPIEGNGTSPYFRVENINDDVATFRVLTFDGTTFTATDDYFTIRLSCIGVLICFQDVVLSL